MECLPQSLSTLILETGSLSESGAHRSVSVRIYPPLWDYRCEACAQLLHMLWGFELRSAEPSLTVKLAGSFIFPHYKEWQYVR